LSLAATRSARLAGLATRRSAASVSAVGMLERASRPPSEATSR